MSNSVKRGAVCDGDGYIEWVRTRHVNQLRVDLDRLTKTASPGARGVASRPRQVQLVWTAADRVAMEAELARARASDVTPAVTEAVARRLGLDRPRFRDPAHWAGVRLRVEAALQYRLGRIAADYALAWAWDDVSQALVLQWPDHVVDELVGASVADCGGDSSRPQRRQPVSGQGNQGVLDMHSTALTDDAASETSETSATTASSDSGFGSADDTDSPDAIDDEGGRASPAERDSCRTDAPQWCAAAERATAVGQRRRPGGSLTLVQLYDSLAEQRRLAERAVYLLELRAYTTAAAVGRGRSALGELLQLLGRADERLSCLDRGLRAVRRAADGQGLGWAVSPGDLV